MAYQTIPLSVDIRRLRLVEFSKMEGIYLVFDFEKIFLLHVDSPCMILKSHILRQ